MVEPLGAAQQVVLGGQVRPRAERREPVAEGGDAFVSMRVRARLTAELEGSVGAVVEVQDVRLWGEEESTLGDFDADALDLHQGYLELNRPGTDRLALRLGRQEIALGGHRLVGNVDWTQQGRSFDAIRLVAATPALRIDLIGSLLSDATARTQEEDAYLLGAYAQLHRVGPGALDLYGIFDRREGPDGTSRLTSGARWWGEAGPHRFRAEASYQAGERDGLDVSAFLVGVRFGREVARGRGRVTLWYDYLSGDGNLDDDELGVFDTLFATNHKFYGFADLFLDLPTHTVGRGLQDLALKSTYDLTGDLALALDLHSFRVARRGSLSTAHLGEELDLTTTYRHTDNLRIVGGFSWILQDDGLAEIGRLSENSTWAYAMFDLRF